MQYFSLLDPFASYEENEVLRIRFQMFSGAFHTNGSLEFCRRVREVFWADVEPVWVRRFHLKRKIVTFSDATTSKLVPHRPSKSMEQHILDTNAGKQLS